MMSGGLFKVEQLCRKFFKQRCASNTAEAVERERARVRGNFSRLGFSGLVREEPGKIDSKMSDLIED
jgi:hypothetical protein